MNTPSKGTWAVFCSDRARLQHLGIGQNVPSHPKLSPPKEMCGIFVYFSFHPRQPWLPRRITCVPPVAAVPHLSIPNLPKETKRLTCVEPLHLANTTCIKQNKQPCALMRLSSIFDGFCKQHKKCQSQKKMAGIH